MKNLKSNLATKFGVLGTLARSSKKTISALYDALSSSLMLWVAYTLRFEAPFRDLDKVWPYFFLLPLGTHLIFRFLGIYRWVVRTSNSSLQLQIIKGSILSAGLLYALMLLIPATQIFTRSVVVVYAMLFAVATIAVRMIWRSLVSVGSAPQVSSPVAIYGAGKAGRMLADGLSHEGSDKPLFFIDDNPKISGSNVGGLRVYSPATTDLAKLVSRKEISKIILALPTVSGERYKNVLDNLRPLPVKVQTVPSIDEILSGDTSLSQIRDLSVDDILGRKIVEPDKELMSKAVTGRVVMITGGGGSIGSEICRQVMGLKPAKVILIDQSEKNLYDITEEMSEEPGVLASPESYFVPVLGSVTNAEKIESLIRDHNVDLIYHAAAYKHVPIVERDTAEGIKVNVFGTQVVLEAAIENQVSNFIFISTDKAVRPTNAMGATKRVAELILQAHASRKPVTKISMVRFGNVLGSSGSVVPKFAQQIKDGGPVTVTHPDVTRFFMTVPEASQLVIQSSAMSVGGEVFVLDMGETIKVIDLAKAMIELYGKTVRNDSNRGPGTLEIKFIGLRPGEKLYEELFLSSDSEETKIAKILTCREKFIPHKHLNQLLDELREALCANRSSAELKTKLMTLIKTADLPANDFDAMSEARRRLEESEDFATLY